MNSCILMFSVQVDLWIVRMRDFFPENKLIFISDEPSTKTTNEIQRETETAVFTPSWSEKDIEVSGFVLLVVHIFLLKAKGR